MTKNELEMMKQSISEMIVTCQHSKDCNDCPFAKYCIKCNHLTPYEYVYCATLPNGEIYREYRKTKFYERRCDAERCVKRNAHKDLKVGKFRLELVVDDEPHFEVKE